MLKFDELPVTLTTGEMIRLAMKSSALWSLRSVSEQQPEVAHLCEREAKVEGGAARVHLSK